MTICLCMCACCARGGLGASYRHSSLMPHKAQDRIVALRPTGRWVNHHKHVLIQHRLSFALPECALEVRRPKRLLQRVKGQPRQLGLNEVGSVLHDGFQAHVALRVLPARHQMQQMHTFSRLAVFLAFITGQFDAETAEHRRTGAAVAQFQQARVEVDFTGQRRDSQQRRSAHDHQRSHRLVEEIRVHIGSLLQN